MIVPDAGATTFCPTGAGMSKPECGTRSSSLKKCLRQKELVNFPVVGSMKSGNFCHVDVVNF